MSILDLDEARRRRADRLARELRLSAILVPEFGDRIAALLLEGPPYIAGERVMLASATLSETQLTRAAEICAAHQGTIYYHVAWSELEN